MPVSDLAANSCELARLLPMTWRIRPWFVFIGGEVAKQDGVQFINLSQHWFASLSHLRSVTDNWREDYNHRRPHADPIDDCCALLDESLANAMHAQLRLLLKTLDRHEAHVRTLDRCSSPQRRRRHSCHACQTTIGT